MRTVALRKDPTRTAPAPKPVAGREPAFKKPPSVTTPTLADYEPPPLRLGSTHATQPEAVSNLNRSVDPSLPWSASSLAVSSPHDTAEKEAGGTASKIMRMSARSDSTSYVNTGSGTVFRLVKGGQRETPFEIKERGAAFPRSALMVPLIQRRPVEATLHRQGQPGGTSRVAAKIQASKTGGSPLPSGVRNFMEPRFAADFSGVKIHTGDRAAQLNKQVNARAFTTGNHIFFGKNKFKPHTDEGKELIAHELTHTIQQGAAVQQSPVSVGRSLDPLAAQRSEDAVVTQRTTSKIHRFLGFDIPSPLDWLAGKANIIPGFRMFTIILGVNPINMSSVDRSAANILRALIEIMPGGGLVTQALDNNGVFEKAGAWVQQQVDALGMTGAAIKQAVDRFIDSLDLPGDLLHPGATWERAKSIFTGPIDQLKNFAIGLVTGIIEIVKDAILRPIAKLAEGTEGYALLKAVMGKDPITGDPVPQTAEAIIGPFMTLIGQQEIWENMKKANAISRAFAWFKTAMSELMGFVNQIPDLFVAAFTALELADIILVPRAFAKLVRVFGIFLGKFISWAGNTIWKLLEIIFAVVAPGVMPYIAKAQAAFKTILKDPIAFVGNLVRAGKMGFQMFAANIVTHLKNALIKWLTGPLGEAGVYIPKSFALMEIIKLVLSVLGLTWQNIRAKLVKIIPDPVLTLLEKTAAIVVTLVKDGPLAAWEQIKAELDELKSQLISQVTQMITVEVVKAAVIKLVSMLNPAGAFVQAILAIYNTVTFFIQKINQIAAVVASFIDSIAAIASGQVDGAAKKVEQTMANTLTVIIAFLAKFAGLGNIPEKLVGIVRKIRAPIDKGLDRIVAWLGNLLKKLVGAAKAGVKKLLNWWKKKVSVSGGGEDHSLTFQGTGAGAKLVLRSTPQLPSAFLAEAATQRSVPDAKSKGPIGTARTQETAIAKTQADLAKIDDNDKEAASGKAATRADALMATLDTQLGTLGGHIGTTLTTWGAKDGIVKTFPVPRGSFSPQQKRDIAAQHPDQDDLVLNSKGELVNLKKSASLARRHVVSSDDMSKHYSSVLTGKKWSEAKLLLEQRGSIGLSHTPVTTVSQDGIAAAANQRYSKFFGYAKNIFIGDSVENSSIQQHLDDGHPDLAGKLLSDHVRRIKRSWAIDGSFVETPVK